MCVKKLTIYVRQITGFPALPAVDGEVEFAYPKTLGFAIFMRAMKNVGVVHENCGSVVYVV